MTESFDAREQPERMQRLRISLDGLSVGDAFGQQYFYFPEFILPRTLPPGPWQYTDDTEMALGVADVLQRQGTIDQHNLARTFADRYSGDAGRGYGATAHDVLRAISKGVSWSTAAGSAFGGEGSMGNGGAMRVAPVGAYFADDLQRAAEEARASAEVTHKHPEGQAGAIAVAVAAATAWELRHGTDLAAGRRLLETAFEWTPDGVTREGLGTALELPLDASVDRAVARLGNGSSVIASDTVPFSLWCAARHWNDFAEALWNTVSGLGDRDTTCAIAGGIVALSAGHDSIPSEWLRQRESLG